MALPSEERAKQDGTATNGLPSLRLSNGPIIQCTFIDENKQIRPRSLSRAARPLEDVKAFFFVLVYCAGQYVSKLHITHCEIQSGGNG